MKIKQLHEYENGTAIELAPVTIPDAVVNPETQENLTDALERIEESIPTALSQLSADSTHRLVTDSEKSTWNAKQSAISDLASIRSGASKGATAVQPSSLADVATSGSYNDLSDKPSIPSAVTESTVSGWGFTKNTGTYSKPSTGIPKTDLASAVQTSLGKADTALQSYTEKYTGTITGIKMNGSSKGTSGVVDLGTVITAHQDISGKLDATTAASTYLTKTDAASTYLGKTAKAASAASADSATKATQDASGNVITSTYATKSALSGLQTQLNTLVSGDASSAIESFNEITAFLEGVEDTETLDGIIAGINTEIGKKADRSEAIKSISRSGTTFTATRVDGTTFTFSQQDNNTTYTFAGGTNKFTVTPSGGSAQEIAVTPSISNNVTYSGTLTSGQVAVYDGTAGKIKASGYTIAKSVPSDAVFTDNDTKVTSAGNHYTPSEDTNAAISAASGTATNITGTSGKLNVVTGVKRDAKGHIVGVVSANIYSTDNNTTYSSKSAASGGTDVSLVTTGEKYTWNAKASTSVATTSANGLMSSSDKTKLNGIASGATAVSESTVSGWGFTKNAGTITGIKMNGTSKGTSGVVDLGTVITAHQDISGKQDKVLKFTNLTASSWTSDTTYADFPYRCDVATGGVTSSMFAEVVFSLAQASSGDYAPICETKSGTVSVWSKKNASITIPTILITK